MENVASRGGFWKLLVLRNKIWVSREWLHNPGPVGTTLYLDGRRRQMAEDTGPLFLVHGNVLDVTVPVITNYVLLAL